MNNIVAPISHALDLILRKGILSRKLKRTITNWKYPILCSFIRNWLSAECFVVFQIYCLHLRANSFIRPSSNDQASLKSFHLRPANNRICILWAMWEMNTNCWEKSTIKQEKPALWRRNKVLSLWISIAGSMWDDSILTLHTFSTQGHKFLRKIFVRFYCIYPLSLRFRIQHLNSKTKKLLAF